jgi:hypothetical protein
LTSSAVARQRAWALAGSSSTLWFAQPMAISTGVNMLDNSNEWFAR